MRKDYVVGVDLAKKFDRTAIIVLERTPLAAPLIVPEGDESLSADDDPLSLRAVGAYQLPRGTPYEAAADYAVKLAEHRRLKGRIQFVLDATGVGEAVLEIFAQKPSLDGLVWSITISPGQRASKKQNMRFSVPKKDLVDACLIAFQRRRLKMCPHDPWDMETLRKQLFAFKRKVDQRTLVASLEAIDESIHDDLALALCLGVWLSNQLPLEDQGEWGEGNEPHILVHGPQAMPRYAETWRGDGGPETHRPAGTGPHQSNQGLPEQPQGRPRPQ